MTVLGYIDKRNLTIFIDFTIHVMRPMQKHYNVCDLFSA